MNSKLGITLTKNALWIAASDVLKSAIGFVILLLVIKLGGVGVYGTYKALINLSSVMAVFLNFGLQTSLLKYLATEDKSKYMTAALILRVSSSLILILVAVSISNILEGLTGINRWMIQISAFLTIFGVLPLFRSLFTASLSMFEYFKAAVLGYSLMAALVACFLVMGLGLEGLVLAYVIDNSVILFLLTLESLKIIDFSLPSPKHIKSLLSLGLSVWIPLVFNVLGRYSAEIFLFAFSGSIQTGKYSIAFAIMTLAMMPLSPVTQLMIPNLERYPEKERINILAKLTEIEYEIFSPLIGILFLVSDELMSLLSADGLILRILLLSTISTPLLIANSVYLVRSEEKIVLTIRGIFVSIIKLLLYYLLTPAWGGVGAAVSYTLGELSRGPVEIYLVRKHGIRINWKKISALVGLTVIAILLYELGYHIFYAIAYGISVLALYRLLPDEDRNVIKLILMTPLRIFRNP